MQYRLIADSEWNVRATDTTPEHNQIVPKGTLVEIVPLSTVRDSGERRNFAYCIKNYRERAIRKREVVLVKILDWIGLIDRSKLEPVTTRPAPQLSAKKGGKRLNQPGLWDRRSAPCITE